MKIRIGNYKLTSSSNDFTISEVKTNTDKESKNFGEEYESNKTYHPSLESALNNVLNRKVKESEAVTLEQLLKDHIEARDELRVLWGSLS